MSFKFARLKIALHLCAMKEELSKDERREWAQLLYTRHDKTIQDVAGIVSVPEAAVRLWVHEGAWNGVKRSLLISKKTQLAQLYDLLEKATARLKDEENITPKDVDVITKYTAAIKNLEAETTVSEMIDVGELFTHWLMRKDPGLGKIVTKELNEFIAERIEE